MNKIKSFVEKFQMFITNLPKFEATGTESIGSLDPKETAQCYRKSWRQLSCCLQPQRYNKT